MCKSASPIRICLVINNDLTRDRQRMYMLQINAFQNAFII